MEAMDVEKKLDMSLDDLIKQMGKKGQTTKKKLTDTDGKQVKRRSRGSGENKEKKAGAGDAVRKVASGAVQKSGAQKKGRATSLGAGVKVDSGRRATKASRVQSAKPTGGNKRGGGNENQPAVVLTREVKIKRDAERALKEAQAVVEKLKVVVGGTRGGPGSRANGRREEAPARVVETSAAGTSSRRRRRSGAAAAPAVRLPSGDVLPSRMASDQRERAPLKTVGGVSKSGRRNRQRGSGMTLDERFKRVGAADGDSRPLRMP